MIKKTLSYIKPYPGLTALVIACAFAASFFESFSLASLIPILQSVLGSGGSWVADVPLIGSLSEWAAQFGRERATMFLLLAAVGLVIVKNIFTYLSAITINQASNYIRRDLQLRLFTKVVGARAQFFDNLQVGHLVGSIAVYTERIAEYVYSSLSIFAQSVRVLLYVVLLTLLSWKLTLIAALVVGALFPVIHLVLRRIQHIGGESARVVSELHSRMVEMFGNIRLIKMFNTEAKETDTFKVTVEGLKRTYIHTTHLSNLLRPIAELMLVIIIVGLVVADNLIFKVDLAGYVPLLVVYLYLFAQVFTQITSLNNARGKLSQNLESFLAYEQMVTAAEQAALPVGKELPARFESAIVFDRVSFAYAPSQPVLRDISLTIPRGKFVALVGPTGAGKSTIINLVSGLYRPTAGEILVDGVPLADMRLADWLAKIGFVSQETILFNDTIEKNISYGATTQNREAVVAAARAAHIHNFISSLPEGYDTIVGERGVKLSGGQKQRLAIARALVRQPEILILDEATSALDSETELVIQENLKNVASRTTVIAIAHRLSTIQRADTIVVINNGRIVEQGSHTELLEQKGFYSHYYYLQFNS